MVSIPASVFPVQCNHRLSHLRCIKSFRSTVFTGVFLIVVGGVVSLFFSQCLVPATVQNLDVPVFVYGIGGFVMVVRSLSVLLDVTRIFFNEVASEK